jgi:hypothetical protein
VYYSCSNQLADDVNELAFLAGLESSKWGPYEGGMYQVHINASADKFRKLIRHQNIKIDSVYEERIVCFTVPNEILITRRNGNIAVQGNTKHASHLVRLMRMAQEILTEGKVVVRRPDAQELLDIRFGKFDYDWLMKWSADTDAALNDLYEKSSLQNSADWAKIDELYREVLHAFWREKGLA